MPEPSSPDVQPSMEAEAKPAILWRGFTVLPEELTPDLFTKPLTPGTEAKDDPTKVADGNERGVYMSTNPSVAEIYSIGGDRTKQRVIKTAQRFNNGLGPTTDSVALPTIGIVVKVDATNLPIRKPQILPVWMGHYNNGFEGDEWIADEIPPTAYQASELVIADHPNDVSKLTVKIDDGKDPVKLQDAIKKAQEEYAKRKQAMQEFAELINSLPPQQALNSFVVRKKWQELVNQKSPQTTNT